MTHHAAMRPATSCSPSPFTDRHLREAMRLRLVLPIGRQASPELLDQVEKKVSYANVFGHSED
jgi:hypothetical protein